MPVTKVRRILTLLFLPILLIVTACGGATSAPTAQPLIVDDKLVVVATTWPVGDFAAAVGGDYATVSTLVAPGQDPSTYTPGKDDSDMVNGSLLLLQNGVGLDPWADKLLHDGGGPAQLYTVVDGVPPQRATPAPQTPTTIPVDPSAPSAAANTDPHVWLNPSYAVTMTLVICDAFVAADPPHRDPYIAQTKQYMGQLQQLDRNLKDQLAAIPAAKRKLASDNPALRYYAEHYGLDFIDLSLPDPHVAPTAAQIATLSDKVKQAGVKAVFLDAQADANLRAALAATGATLAGPLAVDGLLPDSKETVDYDAMMRHDTDLIVQALK